MKLNKEGYIAGLDIGERRIGVALTHTSAALPAPYDTFINDENIWQTIQDFVAKEQIIAFVAGLPRGMNGQETEQTRYSMNFMEELRKRSGLPVYPIDEAATSLQAEGELRTQGKGYNKGMVDAVAATIILQDYFNNKGLAQGRND